MHIRLNEWNRTPYTSPMANTEERASFFLTGIWRCQTLCKGRNRIRKSETMFIVADGRACKSPSAEMQEPGTAGFQIWAEGIHCKKAKKNSKT